MKLQLTYTLDDYEEAHRLHRSASFWNRWRMRIVLFLGVLFMAIGTLIFVTAGKEAWRGLFPFVGGGMFVFAVTMLPAFMQRREFNRNPLFRHSSLFDFSEEGIRVESPISRSELRWDAVQRWLENEQMFLLYFSPRQFLMLPKGVFNFGEEDEFRQLLRRKVVTRF